MGVKFLKIKVERFEPGKVLAKPIYLNMPSNRKMVCVASEGDSLRASLLERLPPCGIRELYAYAPDGDNRSPDTYPIHLDAEAEQEFRGAGFARTIRGAAPEGDAAGGLALIEVEERGIEEVLEERERLARLGQVLLEAGPQAEEERSGVLLLQEVPTEEERTYSRIVASVTESMREAGEPEWRIQSVTERISFGGLTVIPGERPAAASADTWSAEALGKVLWGAMRSLALEGERRESADLRRLAGRIGEATRVFFNDSLRPGEERGAGAKALAELEDARAGLAEALEPEDLCHEAVGEAIRAFREAAEARDGEEPLSLAA